MIGKNELHLCPAEMNRAVEEYLKNRWKDQAFKVESVAEDVSGNHTSSFVVRIAGTEQISQ